MTRILVALGALIWAGAVLAPLELVATVANLLLGGVLAMSLAGLALTRRRDVAALAGVVALTLAARQLCAARSSVADGAPLVVVSHNVLFRGGDPEATIRRLAEQDADVILVQEVTPEWGRRLARLAPHRVIVPHRGTHGMAVLSRHPLSRNAVFRNDEGRVIGQCVEVGVHGGVDVCHVHLASPAGALTRSPGPLSTLRALEANARLRRRQWARLEAAMRERHDPVVVAGDLNTLPTERLLVDARRRWVDAGRSRAWLAAAPTWPRLAAITHRPPWPLDQLALNGPWFRIDYVLCDPSVGVAGLERIAGGGSDHLALRATLTLPVL